MVYTPTAVSNRESYFSLTNRIISVACSAQARLIQRCPEDVALYECWPKISQLNKPQDLLLKYCQPQLFSFLINRRKKYSVTWAELSTRALHTYSTSDFLFEKWLTTQFRNLGKHAFAISAVTGMVSDLTYTIEYWKISRRLVRSLGRMPTCPGCPRLLSVSVGGVGRTVLFYNIFLNSTVRLTLSPLLPNPKK